MIRIEIQIEMVEQLFILKTEQFHQTENQLSDKISLMKNENNNDEDLLTNNNLFIDQTEMKNENFLDKKRKHSTKSINSSLRKLILFICLAIFIYFIWKKQDIFISRLLTSNSRIRRQINYLIKIDSNENHFHSTIFVNDENFNNKNNQEIQNENLNNSEIFHQDKNHSNLKKRKEKLILKTRRNKINFGQDSTKKIQNDNLNQIPMDKINSFMIDKNQSKKTNKFYQNKEKKKISLKNNYHSIENSIDKNILSQFENLIQKKKKHFKSILIKETNIKKNIIQKIIQKRNYHLLTLDQFLFVLNRYQSTILIISK